MRLVLRRGVSGYVEVTTRYLLLILWHVNCQPIRRSPFRGPFCRPRTIPEYGRAPTDVCVCVCVFLSGDTSRLPTMDRFVERSIESRMLDQPIRRLAYAPDSTLNVSWKSPCAHSDMIHRKRSTRLGRILEILQQVPSFGRCLRLYMYGSL